MALDPFTQVSKAIIYSLRAWSGWVAAVANGKIEDMTIPQFEDFLGGPQAGDKPEIILLQGKYLLTPFGANSKNVELMQEFKIASVHASLRTADTLNPLKWNTLIALYQSGQQFAAGFQGAQSAGVAGMSGAPQGFSILGWELFDGFDDAFGQKEWKRDTHCWFSAIGIRVQMYVQATTLQYMQA